MASYYARIYCNGVRVRTFGDTRYRVERVWRKYCTMVPRNPNYLAKYLSYQVPSLIKHTAPYYDFSVEIIKKNLSGNRHVIYTGVSPFILVQLSQTKLETYAVLDRNILLKNNNIQTLQELYEDNIKPYLHEYETSDDEMVSL